MKTKVFLTSKDIAEDLSIPIDDAEELIRELSSRLKSMGSFTIKNRISKVFYDQQKKEGFLTDSEVMKGVIRLDEKRLLSIEEFSSYAGLGKSLAAKLAKSEGLEIKIGRRLLIDREKFDKWCDSNSIVDFE